MAKRNKRQQPSDPREIGYGRIPAASAASTPTETLPISNAKLAADLQAFALAVHLVGLEGLRGGSIQFNGEQPKC